MGLKPTFCVYYKSTWLSEGMVLLHSIVRCFSHANCVQAGLRIANAYLVTCQPARRAHAPIICHLTFAAFGIASVIWIEYTRRGKVVLSYRNEALLVKPLPTSDTPAGGKSGALFWRRLIDKLSALVWYYNFGVAISVTIIRCIDNCYYSNTCTSSCTRNVLQLQPLAISKRSLPE